MQLTYGFTPEDLDRVFTTWEARYRADPAGFMSDAVRFGDHTPLSYGQLCAAYFMKLLEEFLEAER